MAANKRMTTTYKSTGDCDCCGKVAKFPESTVRPVRFRGGTNGTGYYKSIKFVCEDCRTKFAGHWKYV